MQGLLYETSKLDPVKGITYRGQNLFEVQEKATKAEGGTEPLPEAAFWLLLTGEYPTDKETEELCCSIRERSFVPPETEKMIMNLPKTLHPMAQFSIGVLALQNMSNFAYRYREGLPKSQYWEVIYEDILNMVAKVPRIAALVFHNCYGHSRRVPKYDHSLDMAANYAHMLGHDDKNVHELMRMYLTIHMDHEGGNVSAHASHLVASALSDPYYSFSACLNGLAGPLHGLANQEVLRWLLDFQDRYGDDWNEADIADFVNYTLKSGKVIPGFGHAVLRETDPRYLVQQNFCERYLPEDPLFKLVGFLSNLLGQIML